MTYDPKANDIVRRKGTSYGKYGALFVTPFFVIFMIFQLYPIIYSIILSFSTFSGFDTAIDFSNLTFKQYTYLWTSTRFWQSIANTFIIWIINFIPQIVFAFVFAAIFSSVSLKLRGAKAFKIIYYLPNIITAASVAVLFKTLFEYRVGILDAAMKSFGWVDSDFNITANHWGARLLISFIQFWRYFGYTLLTLAASMISINPSYYEAARIDGASGVRSFFSITLPLMRPIVLYTLITSLVGGLQMFDIPYLMYEGGPMFKTGGGATETTAVYIYSMAFGANSTNDYALASAASVYLFIIIVALSIITFKFFGEQAFGIENEPKSKRKDKRAKGVRV